jgi:hypothetical protein
MMTIGCDLHTRYQQFAMLGGQARKWNGVWSMRVERREVSTPRWLVGLIALFMVVLVLSCGGGKGTMGSGTSGSGGGASEYHLEPTTV